MELRNAVSKETLRKYLLTSSAEAIPQARPSLLSCFTNAENPKPQLQDRLSAAGEALESCSETALQSWFDPLEILLDQEAGTLAVRFPHAFFGIRFSSLFQKLFEKKARELWGKGLSITYGAGKFTPSPPVPFVQPAPESRQDALHPAVANPMPFGEEWTFDTFIGNGKHKWALSLARDITRRAVYRATHGRAPSLDDMGEAPGLLVLCGPHDRQDPSAPGHWQRTLPHARERSLLRFPERSGIAVRRAFGPRRPAGTALQRSRSYR